MKGPGVIGFGCVWYGKAWKRKFDPATAGFLWVVFMAVYARLRATAESLIKRYGKPATIIRIVQTGPSYNPVSEEFSHPVQMVETGYSLTNRNDTLIQAGDKIGIISTEGESPQSSDKLVIDGERYSFVELKPLNPGGTVLLYEFVARR